jgi:acyl-CoA synthetase (AMP-forming)/AMP-acid ligase II
VASRAEDDIAVLLYTSGTAKGVELTHGHLRAALAAAVSAFGFDQQTVVLGALPLLHGLLHRRLAKSDEDGYYFVVDRNKDMIIRGGYNVYPREREIELPPS